jgi:hypothetical protein
LFHGFTIFTALSFHIFILLLSTLLYCPYPLPCLVFLCLYGALNDYLLLHIESDRDILTLPTHREDSKAVQAFENDESESALEPQLNPLHPSWSNPRPAWNRALAYCFTQYMVKHARSPAYLTAEGVFMGCLERLCRLIKEHGPREGKTTGINSKQQNETELIQEGLM